LFELQKVYGVGSGRKIIVNVVGKDFEGIWRNIFEGSILAFD
jgi:hypothetical protein